MTKNTLDKLYMETEDTLTKEQLINEVEQYKCALAQMKGFTFNRGVYACAVLDGLLERLGLREHNTEDWSQYVMRDTEDWTQHIMRDNEDWS